MSSNVRRTLDPANYPRLVSLGPVIRAAVAAGASLSDVVTVIAEAASIERGHADEDLAVILDSGHVVLVAVDAGTLNDEPAAFGRGEYNALAWVVDIERDEGSGQIAAIVASHTEPIHLRSIPIDRFLESWLSVGGWMAEVPI